MVLIKPPQACSTAEVYKVIELWVVNENSSQLTLYGLTILSEDDFSCSQRLQLDKTSNADPLALLEKLSKDGISQDVCINDLGKWTWQHSILPFLCCFLFRKPILCNFVTYQLSKPLFFYRVIFTENSFHTALSMYIYDARLILAKKKKTYDLIFSSYYLLVFVIETKLVAIRSFHSSNVYIPLQKLQRLRYYHPLKG